MLELTYLIIISFLFRSIGILVCGILNINNVRENRILKEVKFLIFGFLFCTSLFAVIIAKFKTVLLLIPLSLIIYALFNKKSIAINLEEFKKLRAFCLGFLPFLLYFFTCFLFFSNIQVDGFNFELTGDTIQYSKIAKFQLEYGKETFTIIGGDDRFLIPYHYLDIWFSGFIQFFSGIFYINATSFVCYPFSLSILTFCLMGLIKQRFNQLNPYALAIITLASFSFTIPVVFNWVFRNILNDFDNHYFLTILHLNHGKWLAVAPIVLLLLFYFERGNYLLSVLLLNFILASYNVLILGVIPFYFVIVYFMLREKKSKSYLGILTMMGINCIYLIIFSDYIYNISLFSIPEKGWYGTISIIERVIKQGFLLFIYGTFLLFSLKSKKLLLAYLNLVIIPFIIWLNLNGHYDSWQFFHGWNLIISAFLLAMILSFVAHKIKRKSLLIIFLFILIFVNFGALVDTYSFQLNQNKKRAEGYLMPTEQREEISSFLDENPNTSAVFLRNIPFINRFAIGWNPMKPFDHHSNFNHTYHASLKGDSLSYSNSSFFIVPGEVNISYDQDFIQSLLVKNIYFIVTNFDFPEVKAKLIKEHYQVYFENQKFKLYKKKL